MWSEILTTEEARHYLDTVCPLLSAHEEGRKVVRKIEELGGVRPGTKVSAIKPLLFEARFAFDLINAGVDWIYEWPTGLGESSVDFRVDLDQTTWLFEIVSIQASDQAKQATVTREDGLTEQVIGGAGADERSSEGMEMILVQQKITAKVCSDDAPTKFPVPTNDVNHGIIVDCRGYLDDGGDPRDYWQMAFGPLRGDAEMVAVAYHTQNGSMPILGLFDPNNPTRGVAFIRERIHLIGFVSETAYGDTALARKIESFKNPHLGLSPASTRELQQLAQAATGRAAGDRR